MPLGYDSGTPQPVNAGLAAELHKEAKQMESLASQRFQGSPCDSTCPLWYGYNGSECQTVYCLKFDDGGYYMRLVKGQTCRQKEIAVRKMRDEKERQRPTSG